MSVAEVALLTVLHTKRVPDGGVPINKLFKFTVVSGQKFERLVLVKLGAVLPAIHGQLIS